MVRVMATGVFDILHLGHLHYLRQAKELGDELVVVVARDSTVRRMKHEPVTPEEMRRELVDALKPVDRAILGHERDIYRTVEDVRPDIITLGWDQAFDPKDIEAQCRKRGVDVKVVRLGRLEGDLDGTTKIINKVISLWSFQKRLERIEGSPTSEE
ncbi:MAG: adenylyltransferase/cytidyltransferase family protein [Thermoplasmata archaeon]